MLRMKSYAFLYQCKTQRIVQKERDEDEGGAEKELVSRGDRQEDCSHKAPPVAEKMQCQLSTDSGKPRMCCCLWDTTTEQHNKD